jgi:hypothetical protein
MNDLKEKRGYSKSKKDALDRTVWRTRIGRGYRPVVRQQTEWMMKFPVVVGTSGDRYPEFCQSDRNATDQVEH